MAQILSIYGLVCCVVMIPSLNEKMALHTAFLQLGGGLAVGLCALAAGFSIGIVGDAGEVLGLYGFVISLLMITKSKSDVTRCIY
ncbi:V-type proton ATPase proteolipid subunit [Beauveria bassiana]|uniref:V-type proton ATPase proteolipid subunit n=1 Tax=Beauveria bassiana TaxID=176275 RepID=A0A2N6P1R5_BEABA|nr:V-type proton ATPase proteolipid subunit [Beauveria bassiana]PMB73430.1 V-type proton ATPase proteolipid subunit [Beauveria bassiana]